MAGVMKSIKLDAVLHGLILFAALAIRLWGIDYDLPYIYHPDEPRYVAISLNMFRTGDLNPHFFNYPSLFFYINSIAYIPFYLIGKLFGTFATRSDLSVPLILTVGVAKTSLPSAILFGRSITVVFGLASVVFTYAIGKQITGKAAVGVIAALFLAFSATSVKNDRYITPDTFVVFFATASFLATLLVYYQGKTWQYIVAGLCIGLTASSKYNGGLIVIPLLLAHVLRSGKSAFKDRNIYIALFASGLAFLATTPFSVLDPSEFLRDLRFEGRHYSSGHPGMDGDTLQWYLRYMWQTSGIIYILAALEILRGIYTRSRETLLLAIFPVIYFVFINNFIVRNDRTLLPLTPFLFLLAASFLVHLMSKVKTLQSGPVRKLSGIAIACLVVISMAVPISTIIAETTLLTTINSRETARVWIDDNIPAGSKIAVESYAPFIEPETYQVEGFRMMKEHSAEWYVENGFDYLVLSRGTYGRFFNEPDQYGTEISLYESLFNSFSLTKTFLDGGYEIRIYSTE